MGVFGETSKLICCCCFKADEIDVALSGDFPTSSSPLSVSFRSLCRRGVEGPGGWEAPPLEVAAFESGGFVATPDQDPLRAFSAPLSSVRTVVSSPLPPVVLMAPSPAEGRGAETDAGRAIASADLDLRMCE